MVVIKIHLSSQLADKKYPILSGTCTPNVHNEIRGMLCQSAAIVSALLFVSCLSFSKTEITECIMNVVIVVLNSTQFSTHFFPLIVFFPYPVKWFLQEGLFCNFSGNHHKSLSVQLTVSLWICCDMLLTHFTILALFALLLPCGMNKGKEGWGEEGYR